MVVLADEWVWEERFVFVRYGLKDCLSGTREKLCPDADSCGN